MGEVGGSGGQGSQADLNTTRVEYVSMTCVLLLKAGGGNLEKWKILELTVWCSHRDSSQLVNFGPKTPNNTGSRCEKI